MTEPLVVRVLPDVAAIDKEFDYLVPDKWRDQVEVGTVVRVVLHGRRVGGWVTAVGTDAPSGLKLKPITRVSGSGPPPELLDLARWAAWRWAGRPAHFLKTASPPGGVRSLPRSPAPAGSAAGVPPDLVRAALAPVQAVLRLPPLGDRWPFIEAAVAGAEGRSGHALVLCPTQPEAALLAARLRRRPEGGAVALLAHVRPGTAAAREWAAARAGATVVGTRAAAWAPVADLRRVVVLDEHDQAFQQEQAPTWHAREVAGERAARSGAPCLLVSPCPTLESQAWGDLVTTSPPEERRGWPPVEVIDRRDEGPTASSLFSPRLAEVVRRDQRVACVLNRKGRARLLACTGCEELARCDRCGGPVEAPSTDRLRCRRCAVERPIVCLGCGGTRFRTLRMGVARASEELAALVAEPVEEVTDASGPEPPQSRVTIGTEAVLHRVARADLVAFLDFDQELLAPRYRASEESLALLVRAARLLRGGAGAGRRLVVQTRQPDHQVLEAARTGNPGALTRHSAALREATRMPPVWAVAVVSGPAAPDYADRLADALAAGDGPGRRPELLGPSDGRWILRAPDHATLSDLLAAVPRPAGRLRVEVDPLRL